MRRYLLIMFAAAVFMGLPRLADRFREHTASEPRQSALASSDSQAKSQGAKSASSAAKTIEASTMPVSERPLLVSAPDLQASPKVGVLSLSNPPSDEKELIEAIQKELVRLGYYNGPIKARWNRGVRAAVRHFNGVRRPVPTAKLLSALQAAQPQKERESGNPPSIIKLAASSPIPVREDYPFTKRPEAQLAGAQSEGYLPPWVKPKVSQEEAALAGKTAAREMNGEDKARESGISASAVRRAANRRRHRVARGEQRHLKRRSLYRTASFDWDL